MANFQKKAGWKQLLQSKIGLIFLSIFVLFFAYNMFGFWGKMQDTKRNREIVENKIAELKKSEKELTYEIEKLKTDQGQEEIIREKYGLVREGEGMIVIVDEKPDLEANATSSGGFFNFFKKLFR